jgi:hypothetical protein
MRSPEDDAEFLLLRARVERLEELLRRAGARLASYPSPRLRRAMDAIGDTLMEDIAAALSPEERTR